MRRLYEDEGLNDKEIGKLFGRSHNWSKDIRRIYGIKGRTLTEAKARRDERRGGPPTHTHVQGYTVVVTPEGRKYEHRLIMEQRIGRKLHPKEAVHHVDGDPSNNDLANLVLYPSHSQHLWDERGRWAKKTINPRRDWTEPREKVEFEGRCRVCSRSGLKLDAAHIIPRSQVKPGDGEHIDNIVPLCAERCHPAYDQQKTLDLLPFLTLSEQGRAVALHPGGMLGALQRITNTRWEAEAA